MAEKTKILYLITKSNFGGAQKYVYDLATSLPEDKFDVVVAGGGTGAPGAGPGKLSAMLSAKGIRTIFLPHMTRDIFLLTEVLDYWDILQVIWRERPDILHLNSSKAAGIGSFWGRLLGVKKIIYTVHGWPYKESRSYLSRLVIYFFSWLTCLLAHQIIVISREDYESGLKPLGVKRKLSLIPNGLKPLTFLPRTEARSKLSELAGIEISQSEVVGGTIAELHSNKGLDTLVEASSHSSKTDKIIIISSGEKEAELRAQVKQLGLTAKVFLLGFVPEAARYLEAFDYFILPSRKEGLPYVILEAGFANLPVIGSDITSISDILTPDAGLIFTTNDAHDLAEKMERLATDQELRTRLGNILRKKVETTFSFKKMAKSTFALYN